MQTPDLTQDNIEKIIKLFPNVITEKEGQDGKIEKSIDFDLLRQELSKELVEDDDERYRLDWPGKKASLLKANTPIFKTLRPDRESSVDFDTTQNVYIEGDNFEVLKVLQESYLEKIKMIYIDPPYNTGKDFVYRDNRSISKEEYEEEIGVEDEDGGKLFKNTDTNGRFHSDWLSMMYERLVVAKDLLTKDGVIFISIDDNEQANLKKICDEIFGEDNFIATFQWKKKGTSTNVAGVQVSSLTEHVICYSKLSSQVIKLRVTSSEQRVYPYKDDEGNYRQTIIEKKSTGDYDRATMKFKILGVSPREGKRWQIGEVKAKKLESKNRFVLDKGVIKLKIYDHEDGDSTSAQPNLLLDHGSTQSGQKEVDELLGGTFFDTPKPVQLLKHLISIGTDEDSHVLDFFSGSGTTAHATMQLNAEDGGNRKFIMVQLPEEMDEKSEARKAGYDTIAEIGMERIRRAGKKILEENKEELAKRKTPLDVGFRVYKTDSTNMKDVYYHPDELGQGDFLGLASNIKADRSAEDLLTQVMLDLGLTLDLPIEQKKIGANTVYIIDSNALVACFDDNIDFSIVDEIAKIEPLKVVFKDSSFKDDKDRINVETRFARLSPSTKITVL